MAVAAPAVASGEGINAVVFASGYAADKAIVKIETTLDAKKKPIVNLEIQNKDALKITESISRTVSYSTDGTK